MTPGELMGLLGLAWPRLLLYPGGLTALLLASVLAWRGRDTRPPTAPAPLSAMAVPWLGLALLPLPFARPLGRGVDLVVMLALLEWPLLVALAHALRSAEAGTRAAGVRRLAAELNGLPTLVLSGMALAQAAGTFDIAPMMRAPADGRPAQLLALHWLGALGLALALPPLLGLGPFAPGELATGSTAGLQAAPGSADRPPALEKGRALFSSQHINGWIAWAWGAAADGLAFRALGLAALAALPWLGAAGALQQEGPLGLAALASCALVPPLLAALLWAWARLARGPMRRWGWAYLGLDALLLAALVAASLATLLQR